MTGHWYRVQLLHSRGHSGTGRCNRGVLRNLKTSWWQWGFLHNLWTSIHIYNILYIHKSKISFIYRKPKTTPLDIYYNRRETSPSRGSRFTVVSRSCNEAFKAIIYNLRWDSKASSAWTKRKTQHKGPESFGWAFLLLLQLYGLHPKGNQHHQLKYCSSNVWCCGKWFLWKPFPRFDAKPC